jgi:myo-inositol-hexaphosphate 3-phosphohydrolase
VNISGATNASYTLTPTAVSDSGATFDVVVTNGAGSATSNPATLTVNSSGGGVNKVLASPTSALPISVDYNDNVLGSEHAVAVWAAPNPSDSLMFVTQKGSDTVDVWNLQTNQIVRTLTGFNRPIGVAVDKTEGAVYVTSDRDHLIYKFLIANIVAGNLSPVLTFGGGMSPSAEPMGVTVYHNAGGNLVYVAYTGSTKKYVRAFNTSGVLVYAWQVGVSIGIESIEADNERGLIYLADRTNNLIKVYQTNGTFVQDFGGADFTADSDPEGIAIYRCGGDGYIIVSDQLPNEFEIYDRLTFQHLATFTVDGARSAIGIALTQSAVPGYPNGAFFLESREREVFGVAWETITGATGASTCPAP